MNKIISYDKPGGVRRREQVKKIVIPLLTLLLVVGITVGIFYFYRQYPGRIEELEAYGYLGAFLISLTLNATVILPAGNFLIISAFGAALSSATLVGLAGGTGATIGEITSYIAGYSGRGIAERSKLYGKVEDWVRRWGTMTIFIFSLVPFVFDLAGIAAGILRFPLWKFLLVCWLGRTILYIVFAVGGAWGWEAVLPYLG